MPIVNRATLKSYFETGDVPSQSEFADWLDSILTLLDDGVYGWKKVTINYDDFQPEPLDEKYIDCFFIPAGFQPNRFVIIPTVVFTGGTIIESFVGLFDSTDSAEFEDARYNTFNAVTSKSGLICYKMIREENYLIDFASGGNIRIKLSVGGGFDGINDLTQGSVDIYYRLDKVPF